jgi:16S rRNA C967 or C1407 C5-methylase (RsmB/RsmF family)
MRVPTLFPFSSSSIAASVFLPDRNHFYSCISLSFLSGSRHRRSIGITRRYCSQDDNLSRNFADGCILGRENSDESSTKMSSGSPSSTHQKKRPKGKKLSKSKLKKISKEESAREASWNLFSNFYSPFYGMERWNRLLEALKKPTRYCALLNRYYADPVYLQELLGMSSNSNKGESVKSTTLSTATIPGILIRLKDADNSETNTHTNDNLLWPAPSSHSDLNGIYPYYPMDAASLIPVLCLNLPTTDTGPRNMQILDMCSAPGGKALGICMLWNIQQNDGNLYCTDVSSDRRSRLKRTISSYIPADIRDNHISVLAGDGTSNAYFAQFGYNRFDRILVDAPCSSERHLIFNDSEMLKWGIGRSKINAKRQVALLWNAFRLTKPGGRIVYSTCSLSPYENDDVIEKVLLKIRKKHRLSSNTSGGRETAKHVIVVPLSGASDIRIGGDATKYGYHILPDVSDSWGPIYVCALDVVDGEPPLVPNLDEQIMTMHDDEDLDESDEATSCPFSDDDKL